MADNGSSNTAIVAIVVVLLLVALAYFFGFFGKPGETTRTIENTTIETPARTPLTQPNNR